MIEYIHNADWSPKAELCSLVKIRAHDRAIYGRGDEASDILECLSTCAIGRLADGSCHLAAHCRGEIVTIQSIINGRSQ